MAFGFIELDLPQDIGISAGLTFCRIREIIFSCLLWDNISIQQVKFEEIHRRHFKPRFLSVALDDIARAWFSTKFFNFSPTLLRFEWDCGEY